MSEFKLNHITVKVLKNDEVELENGTAKAIVNIDLLATYLDSFIELVGVTQSEAKDDGYESGFEDGYSDGKYDGGCHRCRE